MQCYLRLRVSTEILGDRRTNTGKMWLRAFQRVPSAAAVQDGDIRIDVASWMWALKNAFQDLELPEVAWSAVHLPSGFRAPTLHLHTRKWTQRDGKQRKEHFEGIRVGAQLTIPFMLTEPAPGSAHPAPTVGQLAEAWRHIGQFYGISPFGSHLGLGRFILLFCGPGALDTPGGAEPGGVGVVGSTADPLPDTPTSSSEAGAG